MKQKILEISWLSINGFVLLASLAILVWPIWAYLFAFVTTSEYSDTLREQLKPDYFFSLNNCDAGAQEENSFCGVVEDSQSRIPLFDSLDLEQVQKTGFTISFWITPARLQETREPRFLNLLWVGDNRDSFLPFVSLWINQEDRSFHFSGFNISYNSTPNLVYPERPLHITYTFMPTLGHHVFINNYNLIQMVDGDEPLSKGLFAGKRLQLGIGNGFYPQTGAFGKFSNLMIFKRTLSSKEIRQLHQVPSFLASRNALHQENRKYRFNAILVSITLGTCSAMVLFIKLFSPGFSWVAFFSQSKEKDWVFMLTFLLGVNFLLVYQLFDLLG